jgi:glycerol-3-phosphate dehydrogenase (NAD(P)+)
VTVTRVGVIGAGSWGTALAGLLAGTGHDVVLWTFEDEVAHTIQETGRNEKYLEGVTLPPSLRVTTDIAEAVSGAGVVVSVSPSQFVARVMALASPHIAEDALIVSASKGIETGTLRTMDQVLRDTLAGFRPGSLVVLSGPTFAAEVARNAPTAVVVASRSERAAERVQGLFQSSRFRVYTNADVLGVELGGALKNVIALGAGVTAGLGFGHNALAAVITRGLAEITRLGLAMGAQRSTFMGLAGLGDLVLTCTGPLSRNRTVGYRLGQGEGLEVILGDLPGVPEGVETVEAVMELSRRHDVEMPISEEVHAMLAKGRSPRTAVENLMSREPKSEDWS